MAIEKKISISLDGKVYQNIIDFQLEEKVGDHTKFKMSIRARAIEENLKGITIVESSREFLGKPFSLMIEGDKQLSYENLLFSGIITNVRGRKGKERGGLGDVIDLEGMSTTVFLSGGKHTQSFLETNLSEIITEVTAPYNFNINIQPTNDPALGYAVQSNQNTFEYLQHLAATHGEYLLYNRDTLYFGTPTIGSNITLFYGRDLKDFSLGLAVAPLDFNFYNNDYFSESETKVPSSGASTNASGYTSFATSQSNNVFPETSEEIFPTFEDNQLDQRMGEAIALQKKVAEQQQVILEGESTNTGVSLGKIIEIKSDNESFGTYRITNVNHSYSLKGRYKNNFTAIPMEVDVYPLTNVTKRNQGQPEVAMVTDTNDPEGMSRIKVQFPWQIITDQYSPWIRVATPYAGGNRGFHFIPELGDSVLIAYEQGNIERPYMQSALYTGVSNHGGWQSESNNFKGITTKGGHIIELNDTADGESILITDKNRNTIHIDTTGNNITISAGENMTLNAKNMQINVEENLDVSVGKNKTESIGENSTISATNEEKQIGEVLKVMSSEYTQEAQEITIDTSGELAMNSGGKITIASGDTVEYGA